MKIATCAVIVVLAAVAAPRAHHSHGNYTDAFADLEGTVKAVHLINPHSWIYLDVKSADGKVQTWALEATSVLGLQRSGVTKGSLKAGDPIKVRCHPLRSCCAIGRGPECPQRSSGDDGPTAPGRRCSTRSIVFAPSWRNGTPADSEHGSSRTPSSWWQPSACSACSCW